MRTLISSVSILTIALGLLVGCNTTPNTDEKKEALHSDAMSTLNGMKAHDPSLDEFLKQSYGYVIFPTVGKAGLVVGGSFGRGEVYQNGKLIGYADISQATVGAQAGGQSFSELVVFESQTAFEQFKANKLALTANVSAVVLKSGAGAAARYQNGVAIFVKPVGGAMVEASIGGQNFTYQAK